MTFVRPAEPTDLNFIINSFLRSLRGYPGLKSMPNELYYYEQTKKLDGLIRASKVLVSCNPEIPDQIYGYVIGVPNKETHFVYVKFTYRKFGLARKLMEALHPQLYNKTLVATHTCRNWEEVSAKFRHIHNPFVEAAVC
jgi:GNAT superfamily N-acetyltransferase